MRPPGGSTPLPTLGTAATARRAETDLLHHAGSLRQQGFDIRLRTYPADKQHQKTETQLRNQKLAYCGLLEPLCPDWVGCVFGIGVLFGPGL